MRARRVRREAGCYVGAIELSDGIEVRGKAEDALAAMESAAALAERLAADPYVQAILPPGTAAALKTVRGAVNAIKSGDVQAFAAKVGPKVAKKAIRFLRKVF